jgi:soluble lytic murein transglycosylase
MDPDARGERWQYWLARALHELGQRAEAREIYVELARGRGYYAFLAADRVGTPYRIEGMATPELQDVRAQVRELPAVARTRELLALDRTLDARREWRDATNQMNKEQLMSAALLASDLGWLDQAIFTLARTGFWEDLELRFPVSHLEQVVGAEHRTGLDRAWILAVIRQESAFNPDARSPVGAMGLMQLMPRTAKAVATRHLGQSAPRPSQITDPQLNIRLGSTYLAHVLERLGKNPVLATAAYNAGPHRVERWLPEQTMDADIWIELIPFGETREYVKRVLSYRAIYQHRLGQKPERLTTTMPPVLAANDFKAVKTSRQSG